MTPNRDDELPPEAYGYNDDVTPEMLAELRRRAAPALAGKRWMLVSPDDAEGKPGRHAKGEAHD